MKKKKKKKKEEEEKTRGHSPRNTNGPRHVARIYARSSPDETLLKIFDGTANTEEKK